MVIHRSQAHRRAGNLGGAGTAGNPPGSGPTRRRRGCGRRSTARSDRKSGGKELGLGNRHGHHVAGAGSRNPRVPRSARGAGPGRDPRGGGSGSALRPASATTISSTVLPSRLRFFLAGDAVLQGNQALVAFCTTSLGSGSPWSPPGCRGGSSTGSERRRNEPAPQPSGSPTPGILGLAGSPQ